jgi:hypothetical protein
MIKTEEVELSADTVQDAIELCRTTVGRGRKILEIVDENDREYELVGFCEGCSKPVLDDDDCVHDSNDSILLCGTCADGLVADEAEHKALSE